MAKTGRHQARHLRGRVVPKRQQAAGLPVYELEDLLAFLFAGVRGKDLQVFEGRRDDLPESPSLKDREDATLGPSPKRRLLGRKDPGPFWAGGSGKKVSLVHN